MRGSNVAIITNNAAILREVESSLVEAGHKVLQFRNESEALPQIEQLGINIVFAQFLPGEAQGTQLPLHLQRNISAALLALTDPADKDSVSQAFSHCDYDILPMPFEVPDLVRAVNRASERLNLMTEVARLRSLVAGRAEPSREIFQIPTLPDVGISLQNIERELLAKALEKFRGNQTRTAKYLNISRRTLIYRIGKYKLKENSTAFAGA